MKCTHIKRLLPLFVGGDLPIQQADSVRAHLFACQSCNDLAIDYSESAAWLTSEGRLELDEGFFDELRDSVWRSVRREERPRSFVNTKNAWFLVFAAAVATIVFATVPLMRRAPVTGVPPTARMDHVSSPGLKQPGTQVANGRIDQPLIRTHTRRGTHPRREAVAQTVAAAERPRRLTESPRTMREVTDSDASIMRRIEIQTADPTVRIIWLVQETPAPVPTQVDTDE